MHATENSSVTVEKTEIQKCWGDQARTMCVENKITAEICLRTKFTKRNYDVPILNIRDEDMQKNLLKNQLASETQ